MDNQLYSFDIFDTLITRRTATPEGIFALMQRKLCESEFYSDLPKRITDNFYIIRIQAEKVAHTTYVKNGVYDVTLPQIYESFSLMEQLTSEQIEKLLTLEEETELENAIPIWENIQKVKELKEKGKRVILISNMYLSETVIRRILTGMDPVFYDIPMYVSGELGKTKGTHTLYHYVRQQEQVEFSQWHHYGDNQYLDVDIPQKLGMTGERFVQPSLLPWEEELLEENKNNVDIQLLLGVSKRVKGKEGIAYQVGAGYAAEILVPYVLWLIKASLQKGIEKLVFIARDGYILKIIADTIISQYSYPIETAYLYGSRKAWRLPAIESGNFDINEFLRWNFQGHIYSYEGLADLLGLSVEELKTILPFAQMSKKEISQNLIKEIIDILTENQERVAELIHQKQTEKRERVIQYLRQELENEKNYVFVELIGSGYTQKCLADLICEFTDAPVRTFFYRLDSTRAYGRNINYAYFPNRILLGNITEVLCGALHGQTVDYEFSNGKWKPIFGEDEGAALQSYGYEDYLLGIKDYVEEMCAIYPDKPMEIKGLAFPEHYFNYMALRRNEKLYDYIADMPYTITGQEKTVTSFAPRLSNRDLRKIYLWNKGSNPKKYYSGNSLQFSELRLTKCQKKRLDFYKKHCDDAPVKRIRNHFFIKKKDICNSRYDLIADRIVIYGAGKRGQLLYQQLTKGKNYRAEVVLWVDKNYLSYRDKGMEVSSPEELTQAEYDQVVIAVANQSLANEIKSELVASGVPKGRILWLNPSNKMK